MTGPPDSPLNVSLTSFVDIHTKLLSNRPSALLDLHSYR